MVPVDMFKAQALLAFVTLVLLATDTFVPVRAHP